MTSQRISALAGCFPVGPIRPSRQALLITKVATTLLVLSAATAHGAISFTPVKPATCAAQTPMAFDFSVGYGSRPWNEVTAICCMMSNYINNVDNQRYFLANPWSSQAIFRLSNFYTEAGYDKLIFYDNGSLIGSWSGAPPTPSYEELLVGSNRTTVLRFLTDYSVTSVGFQVDQVELCTTLTSPRTDSGPLLQSQQRSMGVLFGTNDVVYARLAPAGASDYHASLYLWGTPQPGEYADFDIYARCGQKPTPTSYTQKSMSGGMKEFVDVACAAGQTFYVAIHSYSGRGSFNLLASTHYPAKHYQLTAGADFTPTEQQWQTWTETLTRGSRRFYGVSEGAVIIDKIRVYKSGGTNCETACNGPCTFCLHNDASTADSWMCYPGGRVNWGVNYIDRVQWVAHELGHLLYCNEDEYRLPDGASCGHTIMDVESYTNNNVCVQMDHPKDKWPDHVGLDPWYGPGGQEAWNAGVSTSYFSSLTPDNTPFHDFEFYQSDIAKTYYYATDQ